MNDIEQQVTAFKAYAMHMVEEQMADLARYEKGHILSGKLDRIKVFNTHLEVLSNALTEKVNTTMAVAPPEIRNNLEKALNAASADIINEFMCISFIKDKH